VEEPSKPEQLPPSRPVPVAEPEKDKAETPAE